MQLADFDYFLPQELIAQYPPDTRGDSRLLQIISGQFHDYLFSMLPDLLSPGDLLIFNNTKVIKARLYGQKETGGQIEVLIERLLSNKTALVHIRANKAPKIGHTLYFNQQWQMQITERVDDLFLLESAEDILDKLDAVGQVPLPPYITHIPTETDIARYQTIFASIPGAVAAPTAGLHFTPALFNSLTANGIDHAFLTLHVGAGTFQPIRTQQIQDHIMHQEWYNIPLVTQQKIRAAQKAGQRIIAVGTTSLRALEAACADGLLTQPTGNTTIFIQPGYTFRLVDCLITNFHLPKSTLLMLVAACIGKQTMQEAYQYAISQRYRFFSYGDAMLINCNK